VSLTQSEIVKSAPVLIRAANALKLNERPSDYEKNFCSPLKAWLIGLKGNESESKENLTEDQRLAYLFHATIENLKKKIEVTPVRDTDLFTITATDFDPEIAAKIANAVSRSYIIFDLEQQLAERQLKFGEKNQVIMQLSDNIKVLEEKLTGGHLSTVDAIGPASVKVIEQARVPIKPKGTNKRLTLVLACFMSIFLGIMLAFGFDYINHTFKSPQEIETFFNLPLLGSIPKTFSTNNKPMTEIDASAVPTYHQLSEQICLILKKKKGRILLLTAPSTADGSTRIGINICLYMSRHEHKVLLIDANVRGPAIHRKLNISNTPGLANVLEGSATLQEAVHKINNNLMVLPAGESSLNPITLLGTSKMKEILANAKKEYELVIVDYPNLHQVQDVSILASYVDGVSLVVNEGKNRRNSVKALLTPIEEVKSNLSGIILNNRTYVIPEFIYKRI
ncbi:MAG: polysaccharide biosynthesis tyrosine autokinase, partial [Planctomycetes bacterium]|nr:polysaccharide biosynthesis tyrosine autokinase [Planctomycetota bacterium]